MTWDPEIFAEFWLVKNYLPEIAERERKLACLNAVAHGLGSRGEAPVIHNAAARGAGGRNEAPVIRVVPVPGDCTDGFLGAYWRRPEAYLSPAVRAAMSGIALLDQGVVTTASNRLATDLASGRWHEQHGHLLQRTELDLGYRLVMAGQ